MSNFVKHIPCEKCGSSDANSLFDDNHQFCFNCHTYVKGDNELEIPSFVKRIGKINEQGEFRSIPERKITKDTCGFYGVRQDESKHYYPYADASGAIIAAKVRTEESKEGLCTGVQLCH